MENPVRECFVRTSIIYRSLTELYNVLCVSMLNMAYTLKHILSPSKADAL